MDSQLTLENDLDLNAESSLSSLVNGEGFSYQASIRAPRATDVVYRHLVGKSKDISGIRRSFFAVNNLYDLRHSTNERVNSSASPQDKKELQELNGKFAQYVERITALQLEISPLAKELKELKLKWGSRVEDIKVIYETELSKTRELYDEATRKINELTNKLNFAEVKADDLQQELDLAKALHDDDYEKLTKLTQVTSKLKSELQMFRSMSELNDIENQRRRETMTKYQEDLEKVKLRHRHFQETSPFSRDIAIFKRHRHFQETSPFSRDIAIFKRHRHFQETSPFSRDIAIFKRLRYFKRLR